MNVRLKMRFTTVCEANFKMKIDCVPLRIFESEKGETWPRKKLPVLGRDTEQSVQKVGLTGAHSIRCIPLYSAVFRCLPPRLSLCFAVFTEASAVFIRTFRCPYRDICWTLPYVVVLVAYLCCHTLWPCLLPLWPQIFVGLGENQGNSLPSFGNHFQQPFAPLSLKPFSLSGFVSPLLPLSLRWTFPLPFTAPLRDGVFDSRAYRITPVPTLVFS